MTKWTFRGVETTGPSHVDRGVPGTKHTLLVSRTGGSLVIRTAGANASDHRQQFPVRLAFPTVGGTPDRPNERPEDLYAERG